MAKKQIVWGIDIGNSSLKALRCCLSDEPGKVEALACDFVEHSKVLTQPGTNAVEVLAETLQTFLSRNMTKGDRIAISVSGQNTISRFLQLPPVDPKKIPDVIRYEAKQWLPFDINEVIWDFQTLGQPNPDPTETLIDATVGMFAIKRDVATKALAPYSSRSVDIDSIQSSPIALYNFVAYDQLPKPVSSEDGNDETVQESLVTLCIGTDATDVVITNGTSIWIRNIPLGGNSFTKALTRELQLTFSKAEYLKRNITTSQDQDEQKRVITAMRPVFNDMVNEVNRSLEYYQTLNRKAKFTKIVALGNAVKLPGLRQFIAQNLGYEVVRLSRYNSLTGAEVIETPLFKDNLLSFGICYGLVLQQLGISSLKTNLIPREFIIDRIIREKKPWALAAAAALLLGISVQFAGVTSAYNSVVNDAYKSAETKAKNTQSYASNLKSETSQAVTAFNTVDEVGKNLTSNVEGRITWLELLRAVNAALPQLKQEVNAAGKEEPVMTSELFAQQDRFFIESIEAISVDSLTTWFEPLKAMNRYYPDDEELEGLKKTSVDGLGMAANAPAGTEPVEDSVDTAATQNTDRLIDEAERFALVTGPGGDSSSVSSSMESSGDAMGATAKVVQIVGYHYHNPSDVNKAAEDGGEAYLRKTLLRNLKFGEVELPPTLEEQQQGIQSKKVLMKDLGISYPTLLYVPSVVEQKMVNPVLQPLLGPNVVLDSAMTSGNRTSSPPPRRNRGSVGSQESTQITLQELADKMGVKEPILTIRRFDFVIQFAWQETPPSKRKQNTDSTTETNEKQ